MILLNKFLSLHRNQTDEIKQTKKEIKRLKRTIYAYQLVYGATPEKAKLMMHTAQQEIVPKAAPQPEVQAQIIADSVKNIPIFGEIRNEVLGLKEEFKNMKQGSTKREEKSIVDQSSVELFKIQQEINVLHENFKTRDRRLEDSLAKRDAAILSLLEEKLSTLTKFCKTQEMDELANRVKKVEMNVRASITQQHKTSSSQHVLPRESANTKSMESPAQTTTVEPETIKVIRPMFDLIEEDTENSSDEALVTTENLVSQKPLENVTKRLEQLQEEANEKIEEKLQNKLKSNLSFSVQQIDELNLNFQEEEPQPVVIQQIVEETVEEHPKRTFYIDESESDEEIELTENTLEEVIKRDVEKREEQIIQQLTEEPDRKCLLPTLYF